MASDTRDSPDLEALFDFVSSTAPTDVPAVTETKEVKKDISKELDALTDDLSTLSRGDIEEEVFHKLGKLTRHINSVMKELGHANELESALKTLPDARSRLDYVNTLTSKAAETVLSNIEKLQDKQSKIAERMKYFENKFDDLMEGKLSIDEFKDSFHEAHAFFKYYYLEYTEIEKTHTDIMMSQDYHDLTGQVIARITSTTSELEKELVKLLLDVAPTEKKDLIDTDWLSGPPITTEGRTDICQDQGQVDDLLTSLGF